MKSCFQPIVASQIGTDGYFWKRDNVLMVGVPLDTSRSSLEVPLLSKMAWPDEPAFTAILPTERFESSVKVLVLAPKADVVRVASWPSAMTPLVQMPVLLQSPVVPIQLPSYEGELT